MTCFCAAQIEHGLRKFSCLNRNCRSTLAPQPISLLTLDQTQRRSRTHTVDLYGLWTFRPGLSMRLAVAQGAYPPPFVEDLKTLARDEGLWNFFLPQLIEVQGFAHAVNVGADRLRFLAPVKVGSRIRGVGEIVGVEEVKGAIQSIVRVTVEIEGADKPACVVDTISRYFPES